MKKIYLFVLLFFIYLSNCFALEGAITIKKSYFVDTSNKLDIENIHTANFKPYKYGLKLLYEKNSIWLKYEIEKSDDLDKQSLILSLEPYQLNQIEKYEYVDQKWIKEIRGNKFQEKYSLCSTNVHCFELSEKNIYPKVFYLKINTFGMIYINDQIQKKDLSIVENIDKTKNITISLTIAIILLIFGLIILLRRRDFLTYSFIALQIFVVLTIFYSSGALSSATRFFTLEQLNSLSYYLICSRTLLTATLILSVLKNYSINETYINLYKIILTGTVFNYVLILLGYLNQALQFQLALHFINILVQFYGFSSSKISNQPIKITLYLSTIMYLVISILGFLNITGLLTIESVFDRQYLSDYRLNGTLVAITFLLIGIFESQRLEKVKDFEILRLRDIENESKNNIDKLIERTSLIDLLTHELMNPLAAIKFTITSFNTPGAIEIAGLSAIKRINQSVGRMQYIIDQVNLSNRVEAENYKLTLENIQLNQLILDLIDDCQPNNSDNLKLKTEIDSDCDIHSDFVVISIILKNLIENAIKYNLEGETIEIKAFKLFDSSSNEEHEKRKYQVQFEISNLFDPITRPNEFEMFNRYYRQNNVLSKPGMGIGLSVVKQLLKQLEKEITYNITESQVTFKIIF